MNIYKLSIVLLSLLVAGVVPIVSANDDIDYSSVDGVSVLPFPELHFDPSQEYVDVVSELNPDINAQSLKISSTLATSEKSDVSKIPYGSIIFHSDDGITTVFDSNGNQQFAAKDSQSTQIATPNGLIPATRLHGIPSGSAIVSSGNITYVSNDNVLLFKEIQERSPASSRTSSPYPLMNPDQYVEGLYGTPSSSSLGDYVTRWIVPSSPENQGISPIYVWNGIQSDGLIPVFNWNALIQPVLQWNVQPGEWSYASWFVFGDTLPGGSIGYHSADVTGVQPGDVIEGQMSYDAALQKWTIQTKDITRNLPTTTYTTSGMLPNSDVLIEAYLESWESGLPRYMPGPISFYDFVIQDTNGVSCLPNSISFEYLRNQWPYLTLNISNTTNWPNSINNPLVFTTH